MGRTKKAQEPNKKGTRKNKKAELKDLEDDSDLDLDLDLDSDSDTESDEDLEGGEDDSSMSKELNKMINETIEKIKSDDVAIPAIGISLVAILGFALYKAGKI
jgi:hypothetical protein